MRDRGRGICVAVVLLAGPAAGTEPAAPVPEDWIAALAEAPVEGLGRPLGPWELALPGDHAPHADARTEVWQVTVHLQGDDGPEDAPRGVQLSLFRAGLAPPEAEGGAWRAREIWRGHAILTGPDGAVAEERFGRGMPGLAGYDAGVLRLDGWELGFAADRLQLSAAAGGLTAELTLRPERPPLVADAEEAPFRGYVMARLAVEGRMLGPEGVREVTGTAWFEHLWGELPVPGAGPITSDRLVLQLDDSTDVSVVRSRRRDGRGTPTLEALVIGAEGAAVVPEAVTMAPLERWQGGLGDWPLGWSLRLDDLELVVAPVVADQEHGFLAPVWSGLVRAEGRRGDRAVTGLGTLQVSGEGMQ